MTGAPGAGLLGWWTRVEGSARAPVPAAGVGGEEGRPALVAAVVPEGVGGEGPHVGEGLGGEGVHPVADLLGPGEAAGGVLPGEAVPEGGGAVGELLGHRRDVEPDRLEVAPGVVDEEGQGGEVGEEVGDPVALPDRREAPESVGVPAEGQVRGGEDVGPERLRGSSRRLMGRSIAPERKDDGEISSWQVPSATSAR